MIDDHELRLGRRIGLDLRIGLGLARIRLLPAGVFKALAGLRLAWDRLRSDHAGAAGGSGELLEPPLAEHRTAPDLVALLRYRADDLVTERLHQTAQLFE